MLSNIKAPGDVECSGCEEVIGIIENWLSQANDQQEVIAAIEVVCTYMPDWEATCDAMIAAGVPTVVTWIDKNENDTVVCNQLGMCGNTQTKKVRHVMDDCGECQEIVSTIESYVASNYSESVIATYLEIVCTLVPQFTQICDQYITQYLPMIIEAIENEETPTQICTTLGVCSSVKQISSVIKVN